MPRNPTSSTRSTRRSVPLNQVTVRPQLRRTTPANPDEVEEVADEDDDLEEDDEFFEDEDLEEEDEDEDEEDLLEEDDEEE